MSTSEFARKPAPRLTLTFITVLVTAAITTPASGEAQGLMEKMTNAARGFASVTTEAAMIGATSLDVEARNLPPLSIGAVSLGVSQVEFKESVGVRVHLYYLNGTEQPISIPVPNDQTFVLVDSKGHRLQFISLRLKDVPKGATTLNVPALERINLTALYNLPAGAGTEAVLKVGTAGMIRGIPLGDGQTAPPAGEPGSSPNPPSSSSPSAATPDPSSSAMSAPEQSAAFVASVPMSESQGTPPASSSRVYAIADVVEVNYDGVWYRGMILGVQDGEYRVKRDDYSSDFRWIPASEIRPAAPVAVKAPSPRGPLPASVPAGSYECTTIMSGFYSSSASSTTMGTFRVTGPGAYTGLSKTGTGVASRFTYDASTGAISWAGGSLNGFFGTVVSTAFDFANDRVPFITVNYRVREGGSLHSLSCLRQ